MVVSSTVIILSSGHIVEGWWSLRIWLKALEATLTLVILKLTFHSLVLALSRHALLLEGL